MKNLKVPLCLLVIDVFTLIATTSLMLLNISLLMIMNINLKWVWQIGWIIERFDLNIIWNKLCIMSELLLFRCIENCSGNHLKHELGYKWNNSIDFFWTFYLLWTLTKIIISRLMCFDEPRSSLKQSLSAIEP